MVSCLERMRLMTESQIMHFKSECKQLKLKLTNLPAKSFGDFFDFVLAPYRKDIELSGL